jgi:hypothetical protein
VIALILKSILLGFLLIPFYLSSKSISYEDKHISILYSCNIDGKFYFDSDGRKGLPTLTEWKRREIQSILDKKGGVLLLSRGNFFEKGLNFTKFSLMNEALFDGIILSDEELSYLESNPNLLKLNLPVLSPRDTLLNLSQDKTFPIEGINIKVQNYYLKKIPHGSTEKIHLQLVFPDPEMPIEVDESMKHIPVIYFLPRTQSNSLSLFPNATTVYCPTELSKLGKLKLVFRNEKLIRKSQEFLPLNTIDSDQSWVSPHKDVLKELHGNEE